MKKLLLSLVAILGMFAMVSCGGGETDDQALQDSLRQDSIMKAQADSIKAAEEAMEMEADSLAADTTVMEEEAEVEEEGK